MAPRVTFWCSLKGYKPASINGHVRRDAKSPAPGERPVKGSSTPGLVLAWAPFQARTKALARGLDAEAVFVTSGVPRHPALLPFRYLACARRTWTLLGRRRPKFVVAVTPPVVLPLVTWFWCRRTGAPLVVDCHTATFHNPRWAWAQPLLKRLFTGCRAVLVHTEEAERIVDAWTAAAMLLPDDVPDPSEAGEVTRGSKPRVLIAGSLDANEPVAEAIEAARLLGDCEVRFTGDFRALPAQLRSTAPANVTFTGYLPYPRFLGEMLAADVVTVFSTDPHIMNRAAFEAAGMGRPLVLSDLSGLRQRFGDGALYTANEPHLMAGSIRVALAEPGFLAERSRELASRLRAERARALEDLRRRLFGSGITPITARRRESVL